MRWRGARRSTNVIDRRGRGRRAAVGGGGLIALLLLAVSYFFPQAVPLLSALGLGPGQQSAGGPATATDDEINQFVSANLGLNEDIWAQIFAEGGFPRAGTIFEPPKLVLYSESDSSACGPAQASFGPFYCPADSSIYIDPSFYRLMATRFQAPGDFAQAYVIAHEVAHHVQKLNGQLISVMRQRANFERAGGQSPDRAPRAAGRLLLWRLGEALAGWGH